VIRVNIKLVIAKKTEIKILEKLLQLYLHDISSYFPIDFDSANGNYIYYSLDKYFNNTNNNAYFIKIEDNIVGFILVDRNADSYVLQEMFVLNNYKNKGLGEKAVCSLFNQKRGRWIIKSLPCSPLAEKFWNKAISNYIGNNYNVEHIGKYNRAVFTFDNKNIE
jgi:predicted acetyltransferase